MTTVKMINYKIPEVGKEPAVALIESSKPVMETQELGEIKNYTIVKLPVNKNKKPSTREIA